MRIGRNFNIQLIFDTHKKKDAIRTLHFPSGFPISEVPDEICWPTYDGFHFPDPTQADPAFAVEDGVQVAEKATLKIRGQDHDDSLIGETCSRSEVAELEVTDENGEKWRVVYGPKFDGDDCRDSMIVTRLDNFEGGDPGISTWEFTTTGDGRGYLYRDNNPPHSPTEFWGVVELPLSGIITSLTEEDHPGYCPEP